MKTKIIAKHNSDLIDLIKEEIMLNGKNCDLNHIDVSQVTDMSFIFANSKFNGDISKWDVSNVENMICMFQNSKFNGDISKWNVGNVKNMNSMFQESNFTGDLSGWDVSNVENFNSMFWEAYFNGDISKWDVSNATDINYMFMYSAFTGDLSDWKPVKVNKIIQCLQTTEAPIPYWAKIEDEVLRVNAINNYSLKNELDNNLQNKKIGERKIKL